MAGDDRSPDFGALTERQELREYRDALARMSRQDMSNVATAALNALSGLYVHLPMKRAVFAVDPVAALRRLIARVSSVSWVDPGEQRFWKLGFHEEMLAIFNSLHDLHTQYVAPEPFRDHVAFIPFMVEEFWNSPDPQVPETSTLAITKLASRDPQVPRALRALFADGTVQVVEITSWNGVPIRRVLEIEAARGGGSNGPASWARALSTLTWRWLGTLPVPDEDWVRIGYVVHYADRDPTSHTLTTHWTVGKLQTSPFPDRWDSGLTEGQALEPGQPQLTVTAQAVGVAVDVTTACHIRLRSSTRWSTQADAPGPLGERRPFFRWDKPDPDVGYVRIFSFETEAPYAFVADFVNIVTVELASPQHGLIIDIRGNPGGNVLAGELLLQYLGPNVVKPLNMQFLNTDSTLAFATRRAPDESQMRDFASSIEEGLNTGAQYSRGLPLLNPAEYNRAGQIYDAPVVLLVDALSFSTSDLVAAGFVDNGVGPVIGTAARTGAGGGNVMRYDALSDLTKPPDAEPALPRPWRMLGDGSGLFQFALQRFVRANSAATEVLEDAGVTIEERLLRRPTYNDVYRRNTDLIEFAITELASQRNKRGSLKVERDVPAAALRLTTANVTHVTVTGVNDKLITTQDVAGDGSATIDLSGVIVPWVRIAGYDAFGNLAVSRLVQMHAG